MYTVLLSGGSGKRLWPLSNDLRSKQYLKLIAEEGSAQPSSMVQRVWKQLQKEGLGENAFVCASSGQVEILNHQLGAVHIAVEPDRRNTFPAVALSCAYAKDVLGASEDEVLCVLPVDPYTEAKYFQTVKSLEGILRESGSEIALMGAVPTSPSTKYGYIISDKPEGRYANVLRFQEKPKTDEAKALLAHGALWNCGVFCFRIGLVLEKVKAYGAPADYLGLRGAYDKLPKISFDYEVLEKTDRMVVTPFEGAWTDLGTWRTLTEHMQGQTLGNVRTEGCEDTRVINELDVPVIALGTKDLVIVAAWDGILVADTEASEQIKTVVESMTLPAMYEERRWGTIKTVDVADHGGGFVLTRKLLMFGGHSSSYHYHNDREEAVTILKGRGELLTEGMRTTICQGMTLTLPRGKRHAFRAFEDLEFLEVHIGTAIGDEDINRLTFDLEEIPEIERKWHHENSSDHRR